MLTWKEKRTNGASKDGETRVDDVDELINLMYHGLYKTEKEFVPFLGRGNLGALNEMVLYFFLEKKFIIS